MMVLSIELIDWLVQQAPVVVVMGAAIYWLAKKLNKAESDKDVLAMEVIKLAAIWEEKSDKIEERAEKQRDRNEKVNDKILQLLQDIKIIVSTHR